LAQAWTLAPLEGKTGEVYFVLQYGQNVISIEVKAGENLRI